GAVAGRGDGGSVASWVSCVSGKLLGASPATDKRAGKQLASSKTDEVELGQRYLRADAGRRSEMPRGIEFGERVIGGHAIDRHDYLESSQRGRTGRMQDRGLRLRPHGHHRLDAIVLEGLLQIAADELVGSQGRQHRFSCCRRELPK